MALKGSWCYNAFRNSLKRSFFKGTLGPEGMIASDWLLSCVKFCAKNHSVSKRWVCHYFSLTLIIQCGCIRIRALWCSCPTKMHYDQTPCNLMLGICNVSQDWYRQKGSNLSCLSLCAKNADSEVLFYTCSTFLFLQPRQSSAPISANISSFFQSTTYISVFNMLFNANKFEKRHVVKLVDTTRSKQIIKCMVKYGFGNFDTPTSQSKFVLRIW